MIKLSVVGVCLCLLMACEKQEAGEIKKGNWTTIGELNELTWSPFEIKQDYDFEKQLTFVERILEEKALNDMYLLTRVYEKQTAVDKDMAWSVANYDKLETMLVKINHLEKEAKRCLGKGAFFFCKDIRPTTIEEIEEWIMSNSDSFIYQDPHDLSNHRHIRQLFLEEMEKQFYEQDRVELIW